MYSLDHDLKFFELVKSNELDQAKELYHQSDIPINVNFRNDFENGCPTPLIAAIHGRNVGMVEWLLDEIQVNINERDGNMRTPLVFAAEKCYAEIIKILLSRDASIYERRLDGETALVAAFMGHEAQVGLCGNHEASSWEAVEVLLKHTLVFCESTSMEGADHQTIDFDSINRDNIRKVPLRQLPMGSARWQAKRHYYLLDSLLGLNVDKRAEENGKKNHPLPVPVQLFYNGVPYPYKSSRARNILEELLLYTASRDPPFAFERILQVCMDNSADWESFVRDTLTRSVRYRLIDKAKVLLAHGAIPDYWALIYSAEHPAKPVLIEMLLQHMPENAQTMQAIHHAAAFSILSGNQTFLVALNQTAARILAKRQLRISGSVQDSAEFERISLVFREKVLPLLLRHKGWASVAHLLEHIAILELSQRRHSWRSLREACRGYLSCAFRISFPDGREYSVEDALVESAEDGCLDMVEHFVCLQRGNMGVLNECVVDALLASAIRGHEKILGFLMQRFGNYLVRQRPLIAGHMLTGSAAQSHMAVVETLLSYKVNINFVDRTENTALINSVGYPELVSLLLSHKANPNIANKAGDTPLILAVRAEMQRSVEALVQHGAKLEEANKAGNTALIEAIKVENPSLIELLLNAGASVDHCDDTDTCPLYIAVVRRDAESVALLLSFGANMHAEGPETTSAFKLAMKRGSDEVRIRILTHDSKIRPRLFHSFC